MPRRPKPFAYRGWYCTNAGGVPQQELCKEEEGYKKAELALARLLVERANGQQEAKVQAAGPGIAVQLPADLVVLEDPKAKTVAAVFDEFLDHCKVETDEKTYVGYRDRLTIFYERFGTRPLRSLTYQEGLAYKKWLIEEKEWVKGKTKMKGLGPCTVNHYIRAAKRIFNWAAEPVRRFVDFKQQTEPVNRDPARPQVHKQSTANGGVRRTGLRGRTLFYELLAEFRYYRAEDSSSPPPRLAARDAVAKCR